MLKMTNAAYQQLKKHESILAAAYKGDYLNCPYLTAKEIKDLAITLGYNGRGDLSCTRCRLNLLKDVGRAYFDWKQKLADSAEKARAAKAEKERQEREKASE